MGSLFGYIFPHLSRLGAGFTGHYDRSEFEVDVNICRQHDHIQYTIIPKDLELEYLFGTQVIHEVPAKGYLKGRL
ncbi:MAG TPA: hypothetical protein VHD83_28075 [Puia sp.]|nr:hypothetical protein [Puia sp.]